MKHVKNLGTIAFYFSLFFLLIGLNSCDDDDDGDIVEPEPTGSITITDDSQMIEDNVVMVDEVTVSTDGWLVARKVNADQSFSAILGDPIMVQEGTTTDIAYQLDNLNDPEVTLEDGDVIVFVLHQDDGDGTFEYQDGAGDDFPITGTLDSAVTETVVVNRASITVEDQSVVDNTLTISNVVTTAPAWVVVYNEANGEIAESDIVGRTYVPEGSSSDVVVQLDSDFSPVAGQAVYTRLHWDDPADQEWTFEENSDEDVPMFFGFDTDNTITVVNTIN